MYRIDDDWKIDCGNNSRTERFQVISGEIEMKTNTFSIEMF